MDKINIELNTLENKTINITGMEAIQQQMIEAKKKEGANALKEIKLLCKEFGFTAGMLKAYLLKEGKLNELR
jgi:predicted HicB family RNase H-like nuclease